MNNNCFWSKQFKFQCKHKATYNNALTCQLSLSYATARAAPKSISLVKQKNAHPKHHIKHFNKVLTNYFILLSPSNK